MMHKLSRIAIEGMLRRAGVKGGISGLPRMLAMRAGLQRMPPEAATMEDTLKRSDISLVVSFKAVVTATGEEVERFDLTVS